MSHTTLQQLLTARTSATILQQILDVGADCGVDVSAMMAEPNGLFGAMVSHEANEQAASDLVRVGLASSASFDLMMAAGLSDWITRVAAAYYNTQRDLATYSTGRLTINFGPMASAAAGIVPAGAFRVQNDAGQTFASAEPFTVAANSSATPLFTAMTTGVAANPLVNVKWYVTTTLPDASIADGSWSSVTGGMDDEDDMTLIRRALSRWGASSYGGSDSAIRTWMYDAFATAGMRCPLTRIYILDNVNGPGSVDVYLADTAGGASDAELAIVNTFFASHCKQLGGGPWRALACTNVTVPVVCTVVGCPDAKILGDAALAVLASTIQPGSKVQFSDINQALFTACTGATDIIYSSPAPGTDQKLYGATIPQFSAEITPA